MESLRQVSDVLQYYQRQKKQMSDRIEHFKTKKPLFRMIILLCIFTMLYYIWKGTIAFMWLILYGIILYTLYISFS
jgi:fatty acid desaturase